MDKTLKTVQTVCKVCKIFAEIAFVMLVVIASVCAFAAIGIGAGSIDVFKIGGVSIIGEAMQQSAVTPEMMLAVLVSAAIVSAAEAVVAKFVNVYFKHELKAGTPFTFEGAKEMLRLGIIAIAVPLGASIVSAIVYAVMTVGSGTGNEFEIDVTLGIGIVFLMLSPLLKYGAELNEKAKQTEVKDEEDNL